MPIIEFQCRCGHRFEKIMTIREITVDGTVGGEVNEALARTCPGCGGRPLRIPFSIPQGAHFLGKPDGFYKPSAKWD